MRKEAEREREREGDDAPRVYVRRVYLLVV